MKTLGLTGPAIPRLGTGTFGHGGRFTREDGDDTASIALLRLALDLGLGFFDTAEGYGDGHGEELLGQALAGCRTQAFIATKFAPGHAGRTDLILAAENSLRRLRTDVIDLYQSHWPNASVPEDETLSALHRLVKDGKVRLVGFGNVTPRQLERLLQLAGDLPIRSVQQEYALTTRFAKHAILPLCRRRGITLIAYSPLGQGRRAVGERAAKLDRIAHRNGSQWLDRPPSHAGLAGRRPSGSGHTDDPQPRAPAGNCRRRQRLVVARRPAGIRTKPSTSTSAISPPTPSRCKVRLPAKPIHPWTRAKANRLRLTPSPTDLAEEIRRDGDILKPVKVRPAPDGDGYLLFEGQLR